MKIKIVCIVGPTATGKSDFAVEYALKNNGEIISADSRQVYKGMDIGTGKITKEEMKKVPHYLLDVENPKNRFNVNDYKILAQKAISDISNRGKLPIICGGTGFYIDSVVNDISYPNVTQDKKLREKLLNKNSDELFNMLKKLDAEFALKLNNSEKNNKIRLIRFIEIATAIGKVPKPNKSSPYNISWIGLNYSNEKLKERIHNRLMKRIENGMIEEIKNLHENELSWQRMEELGLEYRYISRFLQKKISMIEMLKQLELEIWHYAKRQMVWFKKNKEIKWIIKD